MRSYCTCIFTSGLYLCNLKIFYPDRTGHDFRIQIKHELCELYDDIDLVQRITIQRMDEEVPVKMVFKTRVDEGEEGKKNLAALGVTNWRRRARNRGS